MHCAFPIALVVTIASRSMHLKGLVHLARPHWLNTVSIQVCIFNKKFIVQKNHRAPRPSVRESSEQRFQRIYRTIRERICLLEYKPGSALSEVELAQEFEVSRTPLRRVLQRLEFEGLVDIRNGVGTIVTHINLKTLKDTYELRIRQTLLIGELTPAPVLDSHPQQIQALIHRLRGLMRRQDIMEYARINNDFHEIFLTLIGNEPLREITDLLYYRVARIWVSFLGYGDWKEEMQILRTEFESTKEALQRKDSRLASSIRAEHLRGNLMRMSRYISQH
jgi:DNA-binding GntR family transcriptional regulator